MQAAAAGMCARSLSLPWSAPQVSQLGRLGRLSSLAGPRRQELHAQYRKAPGLSRCSVAVALGFGKAEGTGVENWDRGGGLVHKLAQVDPSVVVEVGALVQANARVGPNAHIGSGSIVGRDVTIGSSTVLGYNVSLQNCSIGESCILHNGVSVGQDGFGFLVNEEGEVIKKPQLLQVKVGNHVEIGANSCVDRGSWRDTVIGDHTKIDNLVQIGHNAVIGRCCMLCGQVGIGGSATLGDYVVMGGQSGVADHRTIVSKVRIAAKSGVTNNIHESGDYGGMPAIKATEFRRALVAFKRLGRAPTTSRVSEEDALVD